MTAKGNKPPGIASYNLEIQNMEELRDLAETTATIDQLHIGVVNLQVVEEISSEESGISKRQPRYRIGDFAAKRAMTVLELMRPYPGDDLETTAEDEIRFLVYQIEGGQHIIMDQEVCEDEFIATHLLFDEDFNLPKWYAERYAGTEEVELPEDHPWVESPTMGRVLEWGVLHTLQESEQLYPQREDNISVDERWTILSDSNRFHIWDRSLMCVVSVACACLLDFKFDLISWYSGSKNCPNVCTLLRDQYGMEC
jgi:hypothetical protein